MPAAPPNWTSSTRLRSSIQPVHVPDQRLQPHRAFKAESDRQSMLQMRAAGHHRVPVCVRLPGKRVDDMYQLLADQRQAIADLQHERRIHDVLGGSAPVRPASRLARCSAQPLDHANHRIADIARAGGKLGEIQMLDFRRLADCAGCFGWDNAEARLHPRQRRLNIQQALEIRPVVEHGTHGV